MALPIILQGIAFVMEAVTFVQFIQEEALQAAMMSVWMCTRAKRYTKAKEILDQVENRFLPNLRATNLAWGWIALYSKAAFADFADATQASIDAYKEILYGAP